MTAARAAALTTLAMTGFAANSLLCRAALGGGAIDPTSYTAVRMIAGAATLSGLALAGAASGAGRTGGLRHAVTGGSLGSAAALLAYAGAFSFAYLRLTTGTGALILFGAVQATMLGWGVWTGDRPSWVQVAGLLVAASGLVGLVAPGIAAPDPVAAAAMATAGIAWGVYSLRGRGTARPLAATADNFVRTVPAALLGVGVAAMTGALGHPPVTIRGLALAAASGALASGVGYSLWYAALPALTPTRAAVVQLSVPVIAAIGGVALLGEPPTVRLAVAGSAILGGIAIVVLTRA